MQSTFNSLIISCCIHSVIIPIFMLPEAWVRPAKHSATGSSVLYAICPFSFIDFHIVHTTVHCKETLKPHCWRAAWVFQDLCWFRHEPSLLCGAHRRGEPCVYHSLWSLPHLGDQLNTDGTWWQQSWVKQVCMSGAHLNSSPALQAGAKGGKLQQLSPPEMLRISNILQSAQLGLHHFLFFFWLLLLSHSKLVKRTH